MSLYSKLLKIARELIADSKWEKFDSESDKQGWKKRRSDGTFEYRYQDSDPNETGSNEDRGKILENFTYLNDYNHGLTENLEKPLKVTPAGGSTGAVRVDTGANGVWYVKTYEHHGGIFQMKNELLASLLYRQFDSSSSVKQFFVMYKGKPAIASQEEDKQAFNIDMMKHNEAFQNSFIMDCWLANWDSIGMDYDNIVWNGYTYKRIDNGGALLFRAQGGLKGDKFSDEVPELSTLRNPNINPNTANAFSEVGNYNILFQIRELGINFSTSVIKNLVDRVFNSEEEKGIREALIDKLIKRKKYINEYAHKLEKKLAEEKPIREEKYSITNEVVNEPLTNSEREYIRKYTGSFYRNVNYALRGGHKLSSEIEEGVKNIISGMKKLPVYTQDVYRGMMLTEKSFEYLLRLKPGSVIYSKGFLSTSKSQSQSRNFYKNVSFVIKGKTGREIESLSSLSEEQEVLFAPDTRFKVESINNSGNNVSIELTELSPDEMRGVKPITGDVRANTEDLRKFLLNNDKLSPKQRERIIKMTPEELKKVFFAIISKSKGKGNSEDKFADLFL